MNWRVSIQLSLLAVLSCVTTGCVTSALWEEGRFVRFHEPAAPPNLRLFESPEKQDILVQYDEWQELKEKLKKRTYWLGTERQPFANPHKPRFVSSGATEGLLSIPIYNSADSLTQTNAVLAAVTRWNPTGFTLYSGDRVLGYFVLPVYDNGSSTTKKVLLTPLAVTADAAIIAAYLYLLAMSSDNYSGQY